jgi:hypothetical protein
MRATLSVSGRAPLRKSAADPADPAKKSAADPADPAKKSAADPADPAKKSTRRILYQNHAH